MLLKTMIVVAGLFAALGLLRPLLRALRGRPRARAPQARPWPQAEAKLLEVGPDATPSEVRAAHRRVIAALHPDLAGGDSQRAAAANAARDVILEAIARRGLRG